jgi:hypothetical protein
MVLGGAAVYRCDKCVVLNSALAAEVTFSLETTSFATCKAAIDFDIPAARLKPRPFKTKS